MHTKKNVWQNETKTIYLSISWYTDFPFELLVLEAISNKQRKCVFHNNIFLTWK